MNKEQNYSSLFTDLFADKISWKENKQGLVSYKSSKIYESGTFDLKIGKSISSIGTSVFLIIVGLVAAFVIYFFYLLSGNPLTLLFAIIFGAAFIGAGLIPLLKSKTLYFLDMDEKKMADPDGNMLAFDQFHAIQIITYSKRVLRSRSSNHSTGRGGGGMDQTPIGMKL